MDVIPWTEEPGGLQSMRSQSDSTEHSALSNWYKFREQWEGYTIVYKCESINSWSFFFFYWNKQSFKKLQIRGLPWWFQFSSVQSLSPVWLFATPWTAACQASLSITNSQSLLRLMSIELVMPSNHLIFCHPFLCLQSSPASGSFQTS